MNSRQRVLTTFAHQRPDRVPMWCGASAEFWDKARNELHLDDERLRQRLHDDFRRVYSRPADADQPLPPGVKWRTPFGIDRIGLGWGQPTEHPLADATLDEIHQFAWPDPAAVDVSHIRGEAESYSGQYAILGGEWSPFWHDLIDLLGMETMAVQMHDRPELIDAILQHVVDYYVEVSRRTFDAASRAIDIFFIGNDFGSQRGPLVSEAMFRRFLLPHLQRLIELGHDYGLPVQLHCCGGFAQLIPAMVEVGLDALHAVQPCCESMDPGRLKADFGDQLVFNGAIDSHHVLIDGAPEIVREQTRRILRIMMPEGGYVAGASHDTILEETPVENVVAMFDAVCEYGVY